MSTPRLEPTRREAAHHRQQPSRQSPLRAEDEESGEAGPYSWGISKSVGVNCPCAIDTGQPEPGCIYCGGSGGALPCPGCDGLCIVIERSTDLRHQCGACGGRGVRPMLMSVPLS